MHWEQIESEQFCFNARRLQSTLLENATEFNAASLIEFCNMMFVQAPRLLLVHATREKQVEAEGGAGARAEAEAEGPGGAGGVHQLLTQQPGFDKVHYVDTTYQFHTLCAE
jgi:hypothetical protein